MNIVKTNFAKFSQFGTESSLRDDCVYQRMITSKLKNRRPCYKFSDLFEILEEKVLVDETTGPFKYCQIGDVTKEGLPQPVDLDFNDRSLIDDDYYKKIEKGDVMRVHKNDILMSFLLPQDNHIIGKFTRVLDDSIYYSNAFIRIKAKKHPELMYYCLQSLFYKDLVATARIRKGYTGYATLSKDDILNVTFDKKLVDRLFANGDIITKQILKIERKISNKRKLILSTQEIIDSVFERKFAFEYSKFNELKTEASYEIKVGELSFDKDLRFSAKFHRPAGSFVMSELEKITDKKIKHYLAEPIILGASVSPSDYDNDGEYSYISMAVIKNWNVDIERAASVSNFYSQQKTDKTIKKGDIILARSGEGTIGKVAIVTKDVKAIFADFTMRIRLQNYNQQFAYYYFRTSYFQYLIEIYKKGLGNNTNIFPIVVQEFPIPDLSLADQKEVVKEIEKTINNQKLYNDQIQELRQTIIQCVKESTKASTIN